MLPVSLEWQQSIRQPIRNAAFLKVTFAVIAPGAKDNATVTASSAVPSTPPQDILEWNEERTKIASWEPSRWADDGSFVLPEETTPMKDAGWWSGGALGTEPITVTFTFTRNFKCSNMQIAWDLATESYAVDFDIIAYDKFGAEIEHKVVTGNTDLISNTEGHYDEFWKMDIVIKKWSVPGWRARIYNIIFGFYKEFLDHEIISAQQTSQESAMLTSLPTFEFKLDVNNYDRWFNPEAAMGLSNYVQNYQHIFVSWGFELPSGDVEWINCGNYFLNAWQTDKSTFKATLTGQSLLSFMTAEYTEGVYDGNPHTVYDLAKSVFDFSGVQQYLDDPCYILSQTLKQYTTDIPLPRLPCNQLLQLLAQMAGCILRVDKDTGAIVFEKTLYTLVYNDITGHCESTNPTITLDPILKNVEVAFYRPQPDIEETSVFDENVTVTNELELNIMTDAPYIDHAVTIQPVEVPDIAQQIGPLWSLPDGTKDTYDGETGELVRRVGKLILDGTENWQFNGYFFYIDPYPNAKNFSACNCTHFSPGNPNSMQNKEIAFNLVGQMIINYSGANGSIDTFKSWLATQATAGTPVTVLYELETPVTQQLEYIDPLNRSFDGFTLVTGTPSPETPATLASIIHLKDDYVNMTASIVDSKAYKFTLKITGTGTAVVTVNAKEVIISELRHEAYKNENVVSGQTLTVTNQLVANLANADELGKFAASLFKHRQRINFDYNGDPSITPMDVYRVQTHFGWVPMLVTSHTLKYNGAWTGSITGMQTTPHDDFPGWNLYTGTFEAGDSREIQVWSRRDK